MFFFGGGGGGGGGALNNGENASKLTLPKFTYPFAILNHFLYNYFDK